MNDPQVAAAQRSAHSADDRIADLLAVLEVSRRLGATTELQPLLEDIERAALRVLDCERATVFLFDRAADQLVSRVATGVEQLRLPASRGIAGEVVRTGAVINVADAYADARFNPEVDRRTGFRTRNILAFPLVGYDNSFIGVLQVLNKRGGAFDAWDEQLVHTFGAQAGVAVQRQLLMEQFAEKQRLVQNLEIARSIQQALIPRDMPSVPGFEIAGLFQPADETGGDNYDLFTPPDSDRLVISIADATGHGIGPALVVSEWRALLRAAVSLTSDLPRTLGLINALLCNDLPDNRFVTAVLAVLDPAQRRMVYCSAGHGPMLIFRAATGDVVEQPANTVPLGILPIVTFDDVSELQFEPGDMFLLFTDGFFEWTNAANEQFGSARVAELVRTHRSRPAAEILQQIRDDLERFAAGTPQKDDLTGVIVKRV
ncbi:MAG: GAF domain-containing SpoIIE family protein phosphatase [Phycisphaerae bacterium]